VFLKAFDAEQARLDTYIFATCDEGVWNPDAVGAPREEVAFVLLAFHFSSCPIARPEALKSGKPSERVAYGPDSAGR
jgi:hypothetical protein